MRLLVFIFNYFTIIIQLFLLYIFTEFVKFKLIIFISIVTNTVLSREKTEKDLDIVLSVIERGHFDHESVIPQLPLMNSVGLWSSPTTNSQPSGYEIDAFELSLLVRVIFQEAFDKYLSEVRKACILNNFCQL